MSEPDVGTSLGQYYEIRSVLGSGGFGRVCLTYELRDMSIHAMKTFREEFLTDPVMREQFRLEAETWVRLGRHPFVVAAHRVEEIAGRLCLAMQYVADRGELRRLGSRPAPASPIRRPCGPSSLVQQVSYSEDRIRLWEDRGR